MVLRNTIMDVPHPMSQIRTMKMVTVIDIPYLSFKEIMFACFERKKKLDTLKIFCSNEIHYVL